MTQQPTTKKAMKKAAIDRLVKLGLLTAISILLVYLIHFPIFPAAAYLEYDMADVPILIGTFLFHSLFITAQNAASNLFGDATVGEYFRAFLSYGVIAVALVIYSWRSVKAGKVGGKLREEGNKAAKAAKN